MSSIDQVIESLKNLTASLPPAERKAFVEKVSACVISGKTSDKVEVDQISAARAALDLTDSRTPIVTPVQCAAVRPDFAHRLRNVKAACQRIQYDWKDDERVSVFALNQAIAKSTMDIESRLALRTELFNLGLIPA
jgi:hypothetical protein